MSIRQNGKVIAGATQYRPDLFDWKWADHRLDDVQWLRADTFSWQDGTVYESAYQHLVDDIAGKTAQTETIAGITISFYLADDKHKITTDESAVAQIYAATGVAWYYVLDTTNQRFKLPHSKHGVTGIRDNVGNYVAPGAPNITGKFEYDVWATNRSGAFAAGSSGIKRAGTANDSNSGDAQTTLDASRSSPVYGNSQTIQPPATQMYLYFYVGSFAQTALENTAGLNAELFNNKVDKGHQVIAFQEPTSANNYTWYRKYADGWVEQGRHYPSAVADGSTTTFPIQMANTYYSVQMTVRQGGDFYLGAYNQTTTGVTFRVHTRNAEGGSCIFDWQVSGMAA